jgi:hypothetical protein
MKILFRRQIESTCPELLFCWRLEIGVDGETAVSDIFIPELYYDYFFIQQGEIACSITNSEAEFSLPQQTLKTLHTTPLNLILKAPLVLYGARFSLAFAELFWEKEMPANKVLAQKWLQGSLPDLATFSAQISKTIQARRSKKTIAPMMTALFEETNWLAAYSPRHKRRLYKSVYGLSKKEMQAINNIHQFLTQTCDFAAQTPRIVEHVNSELFYDQPHLNNAFKKMTGLSPLAYFEANSILQDNLMAASYNELVD